MKLINNLKRENRNSLSLVSFIVLFFFSLTANAQKTKEFKNTIKINLTAQLLYKNAWQLSYERMIGKNQSLNIVGGYNEFPTNLSLKLENTEFTNSSKKSGYMLGVDYRFYLQKENK